MWLTFEKEEQAGEKRRDCLPNAQIEQKSLMDFGKKRNKNKKKKNKKKKKKKKNKINGGY